MDLFAYYRDRDIQRMRQAMREIRDSAQHIDRTHINTACEFITRKNDFSQVRDLNKGRYARVLVDTGKGSETDGFVAERGRYEPYMVANNQEIAKFDSGIYETICTGVAQTICNTIANMFTSWEQRFEFIKKDSAKEKQVETSEDVENIINIQRENGQFESRLVEVDYLASAVDSALLHIYMKGEELSYDAIWPSSVYIVFGQSIIEHTSRGKIPRPVDYTDIDDASAVILSIGGYSTQERNSTPDKNMYLAYIGACEEWPLGRMVQYTQTEYWPIPDPGDKDITFEYTRSDNGGVETICNPMTYVSMRRDKNSDVGGGVEYPLVVIRGDQRFGASDALPTSTTFFNNCLEIESAWSQILRQGVKSARGKDVITLPITGGGQLPDSFDVVLLEGGMSYQYYTGNAAGVAQAVDTATAVTRGVAASRGVPQYVVVGSAQSQPESGIALALRTQPLIDSRNRRIKMNKGQVSKIYSIESALMTEAFPELEKTFNGVSQNWSPGKWQVPKDESTQLSDILAARDMDTIDHVEAVRRSHGLSTAREAEELIKTYSERDPDYTGIDGPTPPVKQEIKPVFGDDAATNK